MTEQQDRIIALIKNLEPDAKTVGKTDEKTIEMIETWLKVKLPDKF